MYPLIPISESISIPTYLLIISLTYCFSIFWVLKRAQKFEYNTKLALDICLTIMIGGFIGARALHILYEEPSYYLENPLDIFKVWQGGFVFYGGAIAAFFSTAFLIKKRGENLFQWLDLFAPIAAGGYAMGRLACFFNGCCYGKACQLPWAVQFPPSLHSHETILRHPTQLYAFSWEIILLILLLLLEKRKTLKTPGHLFLTWTSLHSIGRLIMETFRDDNRGHFILNQSISTWLSLIILTTSLYYLKKTKT